MDDRLIAAVESIAEKLAELVRIMERMYKYGVPLDKE